MNSDQLQQLMRAAAFDPDTAAGREAFAKVIGVDGRSIRRWLGGANISESCVELLRAYRPRDPVARAAVEKFWLEDEARRLAVIPTPENLKVMADRIARELAEQLSPVLKVDAETLAPLLKVDMDAAGMARDVAGALLPALRQGVEDAARRLSASLDGQEDAVEKALASCVEQVTRLLQQHQGEVADAVVARGQPRLDALEAVFKTGLDALATAATASLDAVKTGLDAVANLAQGLASQLDGHARKQVQERARDSGKLDDIQKELRWGFVTLGALLVAAIGVSVDLAHRHASAGDCGQTRGGGVGEDAAGGIYWALPRSWAAYLGGQTGEKKPPELFVPDHPLPHQKLPPCDAGLREEAIGGGCWAQTPGEAPCGRLFRFGNKCYRPIAEGPLQPLGGDPEQEPRREGGVVPGREQEQ